MSTLKKRFGVDEFNLGVFCRCRVGGADDDGGNCRECQRRRRKARTAAELQSFVEGLGEDAPSCLTDALSLQRNVIWTAMTDGYALLTHQ